MGELDNTTAEEKAVLPLELFFDLVFVLGITQTVALVVAGHDGQSLMRAFLVLAMLWWAWTQFSWTANAIDLVPPRIRFAFFAAMGAALIMAVSVPTAFENGGIWLAIGYVAVRAIGVWLHLTETKDQVMLASVRFFALVSWPGPLAIVVGALFEPPTRSWIWLLGFFLEFGAAALAGGASWHMQAGHFAERHGLIYIIAIGEGIVAIGIVAAGLPLTGSLAVTMLVCVAAASALWWSYFDRFAATIEIRLRDAGDDQGVIARDTYSLGHFPMIAGVVLFAAGAEAIVADPDDPLNGFTRLLLALAIGLAMIAQAAVVARAGGPWLFERAGVAVLIAGLMLPALEIPGNLMLLLVVVLLVVGLAIERRRDPLVIALDATR